MNCVTDKNEKILQFGEGNFLRAFTEYFIQCANDNGSKLDAVICQPRKNTKTINALNNQDCRYNVYLRGKMNGEVIDSTVNINCVSRCIDSVGEYDELEKLFTSSGLEIIISNTTEAGICFNKNDLPQNYPDIEFPAKLTSLLYKRYMSGVQGLVFLPVELIENNGDELKSCILKYAQLWNMEDGFIAYVNNECSFCNTLVDRIVTGHIENDVDLCSVACEPYASWIIQADDRAKIVLTFADNINEIVFCDDLKLYRERKVKILNGTHTMTVLCAYMCGFDIVRDMMNDELFSSYIDIGLEEIKSTINLPSDELESFAQSVKERFANPFIDHKLLDISLNSVSKFKARCLPSIIDYYKNNGTLPKILTFSLAGLIAFYKHMTDRKYEIKDNEDVLAFINENDVVSILNNKDIWEADLTFLQNAVVEYYDNICKNGIKSAVREVVYEQAL